jgi:hypothetical protein
MQCSSCGAHVEPAASRCPACGVAVSASARAGAGGGVALLTPIATPREALSDDKTHLAGSVLSEMPTGVPGAEDMTVGGSAVTASSVGGVLEAGSAFGSR